MPNIGLPPWLRAANPAPYYAQGMQAGLEASRQQMAAMEAQQKMALEAERMALNNEIARQELALRESNLGLSAQELDLNRMVQQAKIDQTMRQYEAQQEYQRRVAANEDPVDLLLELGPLMGGQQTAEAAILRAQLQSQKARAGFPEGPVTAQQVLTPEGKVIPRVWMLPSATGEGKVHYVEPLERTGLTEEERITLALRTREAISKIFESNQTLSRKDPSKYSDTDKQDMAEIETLRRQLRSLMPQAAASPSPRTEEGTLTIGNEAPGEIPMPDEAGNLPLNLGRVSIGGPRPISSWSAIGLPWPSSESGEEALPLPRNKSDLVKGQLYQTRLGTGRWDGEKFLRE